jgi:molybdate/tungstate transport system substrate-binding protein
MIVAYTDRSRHASEISPANWTNILSRPDVEVGRTDPDLAPAGYRTLIMFKLAERFYGERGLAARLLANAPKRNMRPNAADLAALLQLHELDYIYDYESVAHTFGLRFVQLPKQVDLGDPALASAYAADSVRVRGAGSRGGTTDSVAFVGGPILYALGIPIHAPHPDGATRLAAFLLSAAGRAALRAAKIDALEKPILVGSDVPATVRAAAER